MQYLLSFLEGIITFISPCLLPMLPIYVSYFAGKSTETGEKKKHKALINSLGFVLGFSLLFVALGAFAGTLGAFLNEYQKWVNAVCGVIMVLFGLNFTGILKIPFLNGTKRFGQGRKMSGFFSSILFGIIFSISWTPCVGAFLGSALMLAATTGETLKGILMLLAFSLGLGIPFVISAVLIDRLNTAFDFIKKHYKVINIGSGILLIILGIMVATGLINYFYSLI